MCARARARIISTFNSRIAAARALCVYGVACEFPRIARWLKVAEKRTLRFLLQRGTTPHTLARARRWRSSAARASWSIWYGRTMAGSPSRYATSTGTPNGASTACRPNRSACLTTSKYPHESVSYLFLPFFFYSFAIFCHFDLPWNTHLWSPFPWEMPRAELNSHASNKYVRAHDKLVHIQFEKWPSCWKNAQCRKLEKKWKKFASFFARQSFLSARIAFSYS